MFEAAELGRSVSSDEWKEELPGLRARLLQGQFSLRGTKQSVIVIVSGVDGAGKGMLVHRLNEWLDPRGLSTHGFREELTQDEAERPSQWRFWQALPPRGQIAIYFGSWYTWPITDRVRGKSTAADLVQELEHVRFLEQQLAADGVRFLKIWLHLPRQQQLENLKAVRKEPRLHWRSVPEELSDKVLHKRFESAAERVLRETDVPEAPWHVIEATDQRYRELAAGKLLAELLEHNVDNQDKQTATAAPVPFVSDQADADILDRVDLSQKVPKSTYRKELKELQAKITDMSWDLHDQKRSAVLVFEGWDAAGKGSAIRRVTQAMDPRLFQVIPIAAPTDEEHAHHYMWRFWKHLPRDGRIAIFDRSWYGRILVERVEGFASETEWRRAYREINEFEEQLARHGTVICKFWLHVSPEEQLRRFQERAKVPYKKHKITDEDWRNREKWDAYQSAVNDMVARTSSSFAPWTLVAGNDKRHARLQVLQTVCDAFQNGLKSAKSTKKK